MFATVGKQFDFPAAHTNTHHEGHCARLHGHTWTLEVVCRGHVEQLNNPYCGMVVDFGDIKRVYRDRVEPFVEHQNLNETLDLPECTTELIAAWIFGRMKPQLPCLYKIKLWEGRTSYAEVTEGDLIRS